MHSLFEGRSAEALIVDSSDAKHTPGRAVIRQTVNRVELTESELITVMALVREYTNDKELYVKLSEARP